jgi:hypothetical protein
MYWLLCALACFAKVNLQSKSEVQSALKSIAKITTSYYKNERDGAIAQNGRRDATGVQWYESGILWMSVAEYLRVTSDNELGPLVSEALSRASFGSSANFLGSGALVLISETLYGKWNDDILWWALGPMTLVEIYGRDAVMPNNVPFYNLVNNTLEQVWMQYDDSCYGGIYWSRNRKSNIIRERTYKSTITFICLT